MDIKSAALSDVGKQRKLNEDSFGMDKNERCFFVCDGMGGHAAGDFASQTAVKTILDYFKSPFEKEKNTLSTYIKNILPHNLRILVESIRLTNRRLFNFATNYPKLRGMGSTIALIFLSKGKVYIAHVGDSRVYRIRGGKMEPLTQDHSWLNEMLEDREISAKDAETFAQKNVITRALGTRPTIKIDLKTEDLEEGDTFLICSDGLCAPVDDSEIERIISENKKSLDTTAKKLIEAANSADGPDNITVILCSVSNVEPPKKIEDSPLAKGKVFTIPGEDEEASKTEDNIIKDIYGKDELPSYIATKEIRIWDNPYFLGALAVGFITIVIGTTFYLKSLHKKRLEEARDIKGIKTAPGKLQIFTEPSNAEVYSDGKMVGITPFALTFNGIDPGKHNLRNFTLIKKGYRKKLITTEIIANDLVTIKETLLPEAKIELILDLEADLPEDAHILITDADNNRRKLTTINKLTLITHTADISYGKHLITVVRGEKVLWKANIYVPYDKKAKVYIGKKSSQNITSYENL